MPYLADHALQFDCHVLERTLSGQVVKCNYERIRRPDDISRWNSLADKHGLASDGWRRYIRDDVNTADWLPLHRLLAYMDSTV